jgi:hypothetical protein
MTDIIDFYTRKPIDKNEEPKKDEFYIWMPLPIVPTTNFKQGDIVVKITEFDVPNNDNSKVYSYDEYVEKHKNYTMPWIDEIRMLNQTIHTFPPNVFVEWALMDRVEDAIKKYDEERNKK